MSILEAILNSLGLNEVTLDKVKVLYQDEYLISFQINEKTQIRWIKAISEEGGWKILLDQVRQK